MENNEIFEKIVRTDAQLQEKLMILQELDKERETLIKEAEKTKELTPDLQKKMQENYECYKLLAEEVRQLKKKALGDK